MSEREVSIGIPCYNEKDTIERIVDAVRSAPHESREIIVVDDERPTFIIVDRTHNKK